MQKIKLLIFSLFFFLVTSLSYAQQTYYIDAMGGNDNNEGTSPKNAWQTLNKINEQIFTPGDKILLKRSTTYSGQLKPQGRGTENSPIILSAYGKGDKPLIQGYGILPATLYLFNIEHWIVSDLEITNTSAERQPRQYGVLLEVKDYGTSRGIVLRDLYVHDVNGSLVKSKGGAAAIQFNNGGRKVKSRFDGLLIENCYVKDCGRNGIMGGSDYWSRANWYPNLNVIIRNNLLEGVPGDGIVPIGCEGCLIEYNTMRDCPRLLPDTEAAAGIWPWSCDNTVIQYNEVSDHKAPWDAQGFDSDYNCYNTLIQYNYSHDNEGGFLLICDNGGSKMPYNAGNRGTIVRYNISVNDGIRPGITRAGYLSPVIHLTGPVINTKIYNNLFYVHPKTEPQIDRTFINFDTWDGYSDSTYIANNIFYTEEYSRFLYGQSKRNYFENNLYYGKIDSLPQDSKAIKENPLFRKKPEKDMHGFSSLKGSILDKKSPARQSGVRICKEAIHDFFGKKVSPDKTPSIGAAE